MAAVTILSIYSMDGCVPCERLTDKLIKSGHRVHVIRTRNQPAVTAYPTVVYSDGHVDHGQRVWRGQVTTGTKSVRVTKWIPADR